MSIQLEGERERLRLQIQGLRAALESLEIAIRIGGCIGADVAQTVLNEAGRIVWSTATHDALVRNAGGR
jgi:hypothetical protein